MYHEIFRFATQYRIKNNVLCKIIQPRIPQIIPSNQATITNLTIKIQKKK